jgi:hypothetical protein
MLIWRQNDSSRFRLLGKQEAMSIDATINGAPFHVVCQMLALDSDPENATMTAGSFIRSWVEAQIISHIRG